MLENRTFRALSLSFGMLIFCVVILPQKVSAIHHKEISNLHQELITHIEGGINYLQHTQRSETIEGYSYSGEWQTFMYLKSNFILLGEQSKVDDSNCFSVASIHNALAQIYLLYPEYESIPVMLKPSFERVLGYRNGNKFNFWNLLPPNRDLKRGDKLDGQNLVRRPTNFPLESRYINNAANIVEDADDTSLGYIAILLHKKIFGEESVEQLSGVNPENLEISPIFDEYRDMNRTNRHWYNFLYGNDYETGAYLTWLTEEHSFRKWSIFRTIFHNKTFYLPFSICYPHAYEPYLPYGTNDLCGVVNANVLSALSLYDELEMAEGANSSIDYLVKLVNEERFDRAGFYYPNRYKFPYSLTQAYQLGVQLPEETIRKVVDFIVENQEKDGGWSSRRVINNRDRLQSTAYAVNALINAGEYEKNNSRDAIEKGIEFIFAHSLKNETGISWDGGVFFSGGTVVRTFLFWKSDAYTTAIIIKGMANYRAYLEGQYNFLTEKTSEKN